MTNESSQPTDDGADDMTSLRAFLEANIDIEEALNHQFEYYVWFRGHDFRFSHWRHEEIMPEIGKFIFQHGVGEAGDLDPLYVFLEYELWLEFRVLPQKDETDQRRRFCMKSFTLNMDDEVEFVRGQSADNATGQAD